MPKASIMIPGSRKMRKVNAKFKIGNRKSNIAGLSLTTEQLLEKFDSTTRGRDRQKIAQILGRRGEDVYALSALQKRLDAEKAAEAEASAEVTEAA